VLLIGRRESEGDSGFKSDAPIRLRARFGPLRKGMLNYPRGHLVLRANREWSPHGHINAGRLCL
jgi:hypothetical protein